MVCSLDSQELAPLVAAFVRGSQRSAANLGPSAESLVARIIETTETAWPGLRVDRAQFMEHVARLLPDTSSPTEGVEQLVVEDLYLAYAAAHGEPRAVPQLQQHVEPEVRASLAKLRIPADREDDLRQQLWQKLLVGATGRPRILDFSGRGKLRHWVRVAAVRLILDELRSNRAAREVLTQDELLGVPSPEQDPEIQLLKHRYRHEFQEAFESAVQTLSPEERNVLRSYYGAGLTVDEIAAGFGIHRATAARRVAKARASLLTATRRELGERLKLSTAALQSVMGLIQSQLHVSVRRLLG
jgi:RNA polymerase sigma-70 factor (ECF subfamily)